MKPVALAVALAAASHAGCGSGLWLITPRPNTTYQEITRTTSVEVVTTTPGAPAQASMRGATLFVDGAEAGTTPRTISVAHKELRRQRKQSIWLPLVGTAIDIFAFGLVAIAAADSGDEPAALLIGGAGLGVLFTDLYLITGRSVVNEGVDTIPTAIELGVRAPGFHDAARKTRVPDLTRVQFELVPVAAPAPPPTAAPVPPPAPATTPAEPPPTP